MANPGPPGGRRGQVLAISAIVVALVGAILSVMVHLRHQSARAVPESLAKLARDEGTWDNPWDQQARKIEALKVELAHERDQIRRLIGQREIAQQYLNAGTPEPAIALLEHLIDAYRSVAVEQDIATLKGDLAFAYYRVGEQSNCAATPNADVCLVPLKDGGAHRKPLGATEAARRYAELLDDPGGWQRRPPVVPLDAQSLLHAARPLPGRRADPMVD